MHKTIFAHSSKHRQNLVAKMSLGEMILTESFPSLVLLIFQGLLQAPWQLVHLATGVAQVYNVRNDTKQLISSGCTTHGTNNLQQAQTRELCTPHKATKDQGQDITAHHADDHTRHQAPQSHCCRCPSTGQDTYRQAVLRVHKRDQTKWH